MKALSLTQPWASLMAIGAKVNETRGWPCAYDGDIAICSTKEYWRNDVPEYAFKALKILWHHRDDFTGHNGNIKDLYDSLPFGKVVCVVEKYGCVSTDDDNGDDRSLTVEEVGLGDYSPGRFYYPTRNLRRLKEPVPIKGMQGLFNLPPEVEALVLKNL